ncbi:Glutamate carboxypeptidase [Phytophthora cinnamomi]|uniref:Glutamate carboxypeptidase n=1 Tax=Phytophthora cinnamomi TaxID=4785 RepID=UPI00355AAFF4|nr:Glutamate carboxypeptidase [Phytophthora cinnamomi]
MSFAPLKSYGTSPGVEASSPVVTVADAPQRRFGDAVRVAGLAGTLVFLGSYLFTLQTWAPTSVTEGMATTSTSLLKTEVQPLSSVEQAFVDGVQPEKLREFLHAYASVPHTCGTKQDYETALYTAQQWESYGIKAEVVEYYTLLSYPVHRRLAIVSPEQSVQELNLTEGSVVDDSCTTDPNALPPFLAYSATGNVTAPVVFANFGTQQDFEWLASNNVTIEDRIALVRYGANMRGLKVMAAEKYGMTGVLIYSDPNEDGFTRGPVYPEGFYRPEDSFQRGSVNYIPLYSGDPMTPGWASVEGAARLTYEEVPNVPRVPVLPLSYGQARRILAALGGQKAQDSWQGGLPLEYKLGDDGALVLNLDVVMDNHVGTIWDVIGTIEGAEEPEKRVVLGNHRDAWVCGAVDPSSGSATLMEIARGLGDLLETGWRPRRTIVLGSWDGEEYALLGSTEWAEDNAKLLKEEAVAYLNVDLLVGPLVSASSAPSIAKFVQDTASLLPANPFHGNNSAADSSSSLLDQWSKQMAEAHSVTGGLPAPGDAADRTLAPAHLINFMGSGSDFTPFYQHLGIISVNLAFGLTYASYGTYHSTMDSLHYMETQGDPHYASHASMAKWWGVLAMRLANDRIIPFDFSSYALVMHDGLQQLEQRLADADRSVELAQLYAAIAKFGANADAFQAAALELQTSIDASALSEWNNKAVQLERQLLSSDGLPHRPWYKHVIFGPGFYEGYAGAAFPDSSRRSHAHR